MKSQFERYASLALCIALASCAKEPFIGDTCVPPMVEGGEVAFTAALADIKATRSAYDNISVDVLGEWTDLELFMLPMTSDPVASVEEESKASPATSVYASFNFTDLNSASSPTWTASLNGSGTYAASGLRYEDFEDDMSFACWGPVSVAGLSYDPTSGGLHYETSTDVPEQADIIVATASATPEEENPLDVTFSHILGGIRVKTGSILPNSSLVSGSYQAKVSSISLKNICGEGEYDFSSGTWTLDTATEIDVPLIAASVNVATDNVGTVSSPSILNDGDYTALLIPQTFTSDAYIEIVVGTVPFKISLSGITLSSGNILTVAANGRDFYLLEGTATGAFTFDGYAVAAEEIDGTGHFSVMVPKSSNSQHTISDAAITSITRLPGAFRNYTNVKFSGANITSIDCTNMKNVSTLSFNGCKKLTTLTNLNTSAVTDFSYMFRDCTSLVTIPSIDTSKGTNFNAMFYNCTSLTTIPTLDTSKGTNFGSMVSRCTSLTTFPALDTSLGTNFNSMFYNCTALVSVAGLETGNGTNFGDMFMNCTSLTTLPATLDMSSATTMYRMFLSCKALLACPDFIDTSNVTNFQQTFYDCKLITTIHSLDTSKGTIFISTFSGCSSLTTVPTLNTPEGTNFNSMFKGCSSLSSVSLPNTSKGTNFQSMFQSCSALVSVPSTIDTSSATTVYLMFYGCRSLVTAPSMDTSNCTNFSGLFNGCTSLTTIPALDVSKGTQLGGILSSCTALTTMGGLIGYGNNNASLDVRHCPLTHDSAVNIINALASRAIDGYAQGVLYFKADTKATLTADEIAVATEKNWTIN